MTPNILEVQNLHFHYPDGSKALQGINMLINENSKVALLGPNGAGKSTLFLHLNALLKPCAGKIRYKGADFEYHKAFLKSLKKRVGIVFQNPDHQIFSASVKQDISFGLFNLGYSATEAGARVEEVGEKLNICELFDKPTHFLSVGQKKMVALAGVVVMQPEILICDEPNAGLDPGNYKILMNSLDTLYREGCTVIISTHDVDFAYSWADTIFILDQGRILKQGTFDQVFKDRRILEQAKLKPPWVFETWEKMIDNGMVSNILPAPRSQEQLYNMMSDRRIMKRTTPKIIEYQNV